MRPEPFQILFFFIYRFIFWPVMLFALSIFGALHAKVRAGLKLRRDTKPMPTFARRPIWIHASSGEFEYAKPVIRALNSDDPTQPIVVTYFSPSYAKTIESFEGIAHSQPLPLDLPGPSRSFLKKLNPRALLIARTDLWPEILHEAQEKNIPSLLFSATARPFEGRRYWAKAYLRMIYNFISRIYAVSKADGEALRSIGVREVEVKGDTRFDQVIHRLQNPKPIKGILRQNKPLILVAGSTWPEDEAVLLAATAPLLRENLLSLILIPHEPDIEHVRQLRNDFLARDISCAVYSEMKEWQTSVLIVDQLGILAEVYTAGDVAFVGGSFRSKVHSVMEPLAAGLFTLVGPFHKNNREAIEFQNIKIDQTDFSAVVSVEDANNMEQTLRALAQSVPDLAAAHERIRQEVQKCSGATAEVLRWLKNLPIN